MRGSEWRKWDLHIHTPVSLSSEYGGDTSEVWQRYFDELEELSDKIKVIGINDYLFLDGYKKVLEYKNNGGLKKIELILPVIEFRLKEFVGHTSLKRLNYHVIFANDELLSVEQIETHFLSGLIGKANLDNDLPTSISWGGVVTRQSLMDFGKIIYDSIPDGSKPAANYLELGFNNINFEASKIEELLGEHGNGNTYLKNKYFKAIGKAEWEDYRWTGSIADKKTIINSTHFVFSASPDVESALKGKESLTSQNVNSRLLHCSDAHQFANDKSKTNSKELGHCFTWIKADPTFEGLKQIIFEPDERVKIQDSEPDYKEEKNVIESVRFISDENTFNPSPIYLNRNLNVIIGGKSSGKSILLYNIAKTLIKDKEFFKKEDIDDKYNFNEQDPTYNFEITTSGGFKQNLIREDSEKSFLPDIKYLPQNYLVKLAEPHLNKKGETLLKLTRNLLKEDKPTFDSYQTFLQKVRANDNRIENTIDNLISYKEKGKLLIDDLGSKSSTDIIQRNIETNQNKIQELNKEAGLSDDEIEAYTKLQSELQQVNSEIEKYENDLRKIISFNNEANGTLNNLKSKKEILSASLENQQMKKEFDEKFKELDDLIESLIKFNSDFEQTKTLNKTNITGKIVSPLIELKESIEKQLEKYNKGEEARMLITEIEKSINADKINLQAILQLTKEIEDNNKAQETEHIKLIQQYKDNLGEYKIVIEALSPRAEKLISEGLKVKGLIKFNFEKFKKHILLVSHSSRLANLSEYVFDKDKTALSDIDFELLFQDIEKLCRAVEDEKYPLLKNVSAKTALKTIFHDYFFDYWEVEYFRDKLNQMSTGKASFVILMLIIGLSESKAPILIDQPEDNLDNRSISNELVNYLRKKKIDRQIILVTHNANVVVNADAENIIVANQNGQTTKVTTSPFRFDYINGAIENTKKLDETETDLLKSMGIREHVADVVEGGKEAFKKREQRYNF